MDEEGNENPTKETSSNESGSIDARGCQDMARIEEK
mgnify:CR=1 FL=1